MKKATKGAVAVGAGVVLLLGGGGTLAVWTSTQNVTGGNVNAGHLNIITDGTNTGCAAWQLDTGEAAPLTYTVGDPLVPGDVLTRVCDYTIEAEGNHLRADVGIAAANFSGTDGDFGGTLTADVSDLQINGGAATSFTEANDGDTLTATVTVTFDSAAGNGTMDFETVLDTLTLTATQVHN